MRTPWPVILALALLVPASAGVRAEAYPEGCAPVDEGVLCQWTFDTRTPTDAATTEAVYRFDIPAFATTLASLSIRLDGEDRGWRARLQEYSDGTFERDMSISQHDPDRTAPVGVVEETGAHVFEADESKEHRLIFLASSYASGEFSLYGVGPPSLGEFTITYFARAVQPGEAPPRPAATRADPHLADVRYEGVPPEEDVEAVWFDDAGLGDGLFDAHLAVADLSAFATPAQRSGALQFTVAFRARGADLALLWVLAPDGDFCTLQRAEGTASVTVAYPLCRVDGNASEMHAVIPEESIGSPAIGEPIDVVGATSTRFTVTGEAGDSASNVRYPFALGGPAVWSALNPRLDPPVTATAWYEDPLASENIPNTLQVLGAIVAVVTTILGALVLWRTRRQTRELLSRVDGLVARTDADTRAALLALGELEREFTRLYHDGRINETQYQVTTQRVVAAASRLALRKELGLDDGTPDAAPEDPGVVRLRPSP